MYISCLPANCNISPNISTLIPPTFLQSSHFNLYVLWKIYILVYSAVLFVWCSNNWVSLQLRVAPPFHQAMNILHYSIGKKWYFWSLHALKDINYRTTYQTMEIFHVCLIRNLLEIDFSKNSPRSAWAEDEFSFNLYITHTHPPEILAKWGWLSKIINFHCIFPIFTVMHLQSLQRWIIYQMSIEFYAD